MTTIKDIAKISGYSIGTVSRVINHHADVSEKARQRIEEVIAETGFQPNTNAKMLKQQAPGSITILIKGTQNVFLESILEEMQGILRESGESAEVTFIADDANEVELAMNICRDNNSKGIIFLGGNIAFFEKAFQNIEVPCVLVTESAKDLGFANLSSYATDDVQASREAVEYLHRMGHQHIGILGGERTDQKGMVGYRRYRSAMEYMLEKNIPYDDELQYEPSNFSLKSGYEAGLALLKKNKALTAIYCISDEIAIGAVRAAADLGMNVPEDISVIGYDGLEYTRYSIPRLATVRQNVDELARRSVEDLLIRINYEKRPVRHEMIPFRVLTGESIRNLKKERKD